MVQNHMTTIEIRQLLDACRSDDPSRQIAALHGLLDQRAFDTAPELVDLLASADPVVRSTAADVVGQLGVYSTEQTGPALVKLLNDVEEIVRSSAADALGLLGYTPALLPVMEALQRDKAPLVRASAAETLGDLGDSRAVPALQIAVRHDPDDAVRGYAANALGLLGTPSLLPYLALCLQAEETLATRAELYGARYRLGAADDIRPLLDMLEMDDETVVTLVLNVLGDLLERRTPDRLQADAPLMRAALLALARRMPLVAGHIEQLATALAAYVA